MEETLVVRIKAVLDDFKEQCNAAAKSAKGIETEVSGMSKKVSNSFSKVAKTIAAAFSIKAIKDFTKSCVQSAAQVQAENSAFVSTLGENTNAMIDQLKRLGDETGITYTRMTHEATQYYNKWVQAGYDAQAAIEMTTQSLKLGADAAAYYDMSLDDANSRIKSFINGNLNAGDAIGIATNAAQIAAWATENLGIEYDKCSEAQKQAIRQDYIQYMYDIAGVTDQAARESEGYENVVGNLKEAWRQFQATVGQPILENVVIPAIELLTEKLGSAQEKIGNVIAKVNEFKSSFEGVESVSEFFAVLADKIGISQFALEAIVTVVGIAVTAFAAYEVILGTIAVATAVATAATSAFAAVVAIVTSPIFLVVAAITALIAIIALLIIHWDDLKAIAKNTWDSICSFVSTGVAKVKGFFQDMASNLKAKAEEIKTTVGAKFEALKETMSNAMASAKEAVASKLDEMKSIYEAKGGGIKGVAAVVMEGIKSTFSSAFDAINNLTGGKLDAVKQAFNTALEGARSIVKSGIDKIKSLFNFSWSLPNLKLPHFSVSGKFGLNPPTVPHISMSWYAKGGVFDTPTLFGYGNGQIGGLGENGAEAVVPLENNTEWLDRIAERLNGNAANTPIILQVDGKTFAQTSISTINQLTKQTGRLALNIA